jgi:hypothetical protein
MNKYKEAICCKCLGAILVLGHDYSDDFYCNSCAWAKVGGVVGNPTTPTEVQS